MNISISILKYSIIFLLIFSFLLFLFIILRRIFSYQRKEKFKRQYQQIEQDILKAILLACPEFSIQVAHKYKPYSKALTKALCTYMKAVTGSARNQLKIIFDKCLKENIHRDIRSRRLSKRLRAARLFAIFSDPSETDLLIKVLSDKPIIRLTAMSGLANISSKESIYNIFKAFKKDPKPNIHAYFNALFSMGNAIGPFIKNYLNKNLSSDKLGLLIDLVGHIGLLQLYPNILVFSNHHDVEIRIRVARALGNLYISDSIDTLMKLASDPAWQVKVEAIEALGKLKSLDSLDILTDALFSPLYDVRLKAALALANTKFPGIQRLKEVSRQKKDRNASEVASMILNDFHYTEKYD